MDSPTPLPHVTASYQHNSIIIVTLWYQTTNSSLCACLCVCSGLRPRWITVNQQNPIDSAAWWWQLVAPCRSGAWARCQSLFKSHLPINWWKTCAPAAGCWRNCEAEGIFELNCSCGNIMNVHPCSFTFYASLQLFKLSYTALLLPNNLLLTVSP